MTIGSEVGYGDLERVAPGSRLTMDDPWDWLAKGWQDLLRAPTVSIAYGGVIALFGVGLTYLLFEMGLIYLMLPLSGGFMILAPVLAVGLYEASRRMEAGLPVTLADCLAVIGRSRGQLQLMSALLLLLHFFWIWIALLIFMLFFGMKAPSPGMLLDDLFFQPKSLPFLIVGTGAGFLLACVAFSISAISIPMLVDPDRDVGIVTAVTISVRTVFTHWETMGLWAGLIAVFSIAGFVGFMVGLAVSLPLIGYATWHGYRACVALPEVSAVLASR